MATKCDPIRAQLQALQEKLDKTPKYVSGAQGKGQQKLNEEWVNLDSHVRRTRMSLQECEFTD